MRIGLDSVSIIVRLWPSEQDCAHFLQRFGGALNLEVQVQQKKAFYSLTLQSEPDGDELWTVGCSTEDHGILPEVIALNAAHTLVIGADNDVHFLSWTDKALMKRVRLGFLFRSFIVDHVRSLILVVHEAGLTALSMDGSERWKLVRDVVETVRVTGDRLEISFMDEAPIRVEINTGREVDA